MIDRKRLLSDLKPLLRELETDLRARCDEVPQINADLKNEYDQARAAGRTAAAYEEWRADLITQVAVAWVLSSIFVRFLEDNALITPPRISGPVHADRPEAGLQRARDERDAYFRTHPKQTDREYLLMVFDDLAGLPGTKDVFGSHNVVLAYRNWLSGDGAQKLIEFFQKIDTDGTGELIHDFTDGNADTRFLGDLYQDLSEAARKKYALLQTPVFVEEFILDRTLEPAIAEFDLKDFKIIDPACGSGHFLLGSFARILGHWRRKEPGSGDRELVNRALAAVHGVDLNPYAVAIARFRLLLAAMRECDITRLADAPAFALNLVCGDSLLHGSPAHEQQLLGFHELAHAYQSEDLPELQRILRPGTYHAVVANPPYITVKDRALNQAYRERYPEVCYRQYSLSVPFLPRIFSLACPGGFTGQITANSFMKREFGRKLVENYLPKIDLTHVVDTSGAYIPGHGTPTVILFGRHRKPVAPGVRAVLGIRGEPGTPPDPAHGQVWTAILSQIDRVGSQSEFISVNGTPREQLAEHPWSIGGGGAAQLWGLVADSCSDRLGTQAAEIGGVVLTREDYAYVLGWGAGRRLGGGQVRVRLYVRGEQVRDWSFGKSLAAIWPYSPETLEAAASPGTLKVLWPFRSGLCRRVAYGSTQTARGLTWFEYSMFFRHRFRAERLLSFSNMATHNHFTVSSGGTLFNAHAPIIKLRADATEDDHLGLLGLLNSSIACFWLKQIGHNKGDSTDQHGARTTGDVAFNTYEYSATMVSDFPLCQGRPVGLARELDALARELSATVPAAICESCTPTAAALAKGREKAASLRARMIALQEELDWQCYGLYELLENPPLAQPPQPLQLGQRAFEIVLARRLAAGEEQSAWFTRHGSTPITDIPADWPEAYRRIVQQRIDIVESNANIALIERPECKRRWESEPWDVQQLRALQSWLLDRLESYFDLDGRMNKSHAITARGNLTQPQLTTVARLADLARTDADFMQVAEIFTARVDFDVGALVGELAAAESVPALPVLRYKPAALDKRRAWERTWDLQRQEDQLQAQIDDLEQKMKQANSANAPTTALESQIAALKKQMPDIPVPPRYASADFLSSDFWRLRDKLDVPKERWVSFPYCEDEDGTLLIAWAGYNHLQLAGAIAEHYELAKEQQGRKLVALLAAIGELVPWLKQWHNDLDAAHGVRMGDYFAGYLTQEAKELGKTVQEVMAWSPPEKARRRRKGSGVS